MTRELKQSEEVLKLKRILKLAAKLREQFRITTKLTQKQIDKLSEITRLAREIENPQTRTLSGPSKAERLTNEILDVILALATLDFSKTVEVGYEDSNFNAVATGLNMLGQELKRSVVSKNELEKVVIQLTQAEKQLQKAYEHLEQLVQDRTKELLDANNALVIEVEERKKAEYEAKTREEKYRNIFESTVVSVWEQDVGKLYQAIDELNAQTIPIEQLFEQNPDLIKMLLKKIKILNVNIATLNMFEADNKEEVMAGVEKTFTEIGFQTFKEMIIDIANEKPLSQRQTEFVSFKGKKIQALIQISFINSRVALAHIVDITVQKALEQQLRQSQKMEAVGQLAGGVAHDFNNLLTVILSYGQLIIDDLSPEDPMITKLRAIIECGERAAALTRQLLSFSRADVISPKTLDLNTTVAKIEKMLHRILGENIQLQTILAPDCGKIKADEGQVEQIIMNLSVNARDAMPNGGALTIKTDNFMVSSDEKGLFEGRYVRLMVCDEGHGMTDEVRSHIFEPFFTTKEVGKGTGLGLSTVYGIAKQNRAHIIVDSIIGTGSCFTVYFPRIDDELASELLPAISLLPAPSHIGQETILLVEDEDPVRLVSSMALKKQGYQVLEAINAEEACAIANDLNVNIDLLLSDVIMPGITGPELANKMRRDGRRELKVLFVSGYADNAFKKFDTLNKKINFLAKPFLPAQLIKKVRNTLDDRGDD